MNAGLVVSVFVQLMTAPVKSALSGAGTVT